MVNLNKVNKYELGKSLMPEKIYKMKFKKNLENLYEKLYFDNFNYLFIFNFFALSVLLSLILYIIVYPYIYIYFNDYLTSTFIWKFIIIFLTYFFINLLIYFLVLFAFYFYNLSIFQKKQIEIEKDLPEFLDNLVSNLKGGISLEKALLRSVRKEQIVLLKEVSLINEKIMMGMVVIEALREFRLRYINSQIISRTFFLVEEGLKGGGNLSEPLEKISVNLKNIYLLNDEIKANAGGFSVVISVISIVVAPVLFALAITLLTFISNLFALLAKSGTSFMSATTVPEEFSTYLIVFSYAMIFLITTFSSLIVAQFKNEDIFVALKYLPFYVAIALIIYWQASNLLLGFFANIF